MKRIDDMTEAQFKAEMRQLYRRLGFDAMMQILYEVMKSAEWISEIILEEKLKEKKRCQD